MCAKPTDKRVDAYLKYSGMAFQMAAVIMISIFAGQWLDKKLSLSEPYMTILLTVVLFGGYMYKLTRELTNQK